MPISLGKQGEWMASMYETLNCTLKLFYCKLFTSVINRLLVYLKMNEWMNECINGVWGVNLKLFGAVVVKYLEICEPCGKKRAYIWCIRQQTKTSVFFIFFLSYVLLQWSYDKIYDCYTSYKAAWCFCSAWLDDVITSFTTCRLGAWIETRHHRNKRLLTHRCQTATWWRTSRQGEKHHENI